MATIDISKPVEFPPAQYAWANSTGKSNSLENKAFIHAAFRETDRLMLIKCAQQFTPEHLYDLSYADEPIRELWGHKHNINRSEVMSYEPKLLWAVKEAWDYLKQIVKAPQMPLVRPGDSVVSFCWTKPSKRLEVSFYIDEDINQVVYDWVLEEPSGKTIGDPTVFKAEYMSRRVLDFARA